MGRWCSNQSSMCSNPSSTRLCSSQCCKWRSNRYCHTFNDAERFLFELPHVVPWSSEVVCTIFPRRDFFACVFFGQDSMFASKGDAVRVDIQLELACPAFARHEGRQCCAAC